jgi:ubiquinone/menaquinone biosynthesis C-methylase UbiE
MGFYHDHILPHLIDCACSSPAIEAQRREVVPEARGRVLEVGTGSGLNLPLYDASRVDLVWALEPSAGMRRRAAARVAGVPIEVRWLELPGEEIPLDDASVDTVLLTYTLCTIPDWRRALEQMRRVLRADGRLLFCEHGAAPDAGVRRWQDRLNPVWTRVAGGCNLNRPIDRYLEAAGFHIAQLEAGYLPRTPRIAGYTYRGFATRD